MAQNIDEVYSDLVQDERFKSLYPTQSDFVQYLENEPTADADIEELFGIRSASEYLKKKDQSIIQNLGEENSFSQSPLVGQTEPVSQEPQAMVEQPQQGGDQNLGGVEDPYGLQALGLPPLGYGKSAEGGPQPTKKVDPAVAQYVGSLDLLVKEARGKGDITALTNVLKTIGQFQLDPKYSQYVKQGQLKNQYDQLNSVIADIYAKKPMAFSDKQFQEGLTKMGLMNPVGAKPQVLETARKENSPTMFPKQPGAPFIQKPIQQLIDEISTPEPLDQKSKAVISYLSSYDEEKNAFDYDIQLLMGNNQNPGYEMSSTLKADYLTSQEQTFDKTFQADVNNMLGDAIYNLPNNFFDNDAIIKKSVEVIDGKTGNVRTVTENKVNPNRKLTTDYGIYMLDDAGNPKVNPIYLDRYVERMMTLPSGIVTPQVVDAFNMKRKASGLDEYTKEDIVKIIKPRVLRLATISAQQNLENSIVEQRLAKINVFEDEVEKVNRDLDYDVKMLVSNSQKLINNYQIEIVESSKEEVDVLTSKLQKTNEQLYNEYTISAQNTASPELKNAAYQTYLQRVSENSSMYEEQLSAIRKNSENTFKDYALKIEGDAKVELDGIKKKYGVVADANEEGKLTTAAYRKYVEAYKDQYNQYKTQEQVNSNAMGWRLTDILQSGSARVFGNAIQALNAAVGYEDNPLTDLMKYMDFVQTKSEVAIKPFSQVLDDEGLFSVQALKTAVQSTVQQGPNLGMGIAATALSGNPFIGGSLMWGSETIDQVGQNYRDVFARTGSVLQAENAAAETLQTQILIAPVYTVSMLPFTKGFLSKLARGGNALGFAKKFGYGLALEAGEEIPVEITQNYLSYKFGTDTPEKFATWLSKNGGNTALDVLPSIAVLGGGSAGMETYSERMTEQAKGRVLATLGRLGMSQTVADAIQVIGEGGVNILPEYLYRTQQIDINELKDMKRAFGEVVKALPQAQELIRDQDAQKYYVTLASRKAEVQRKLEETQDESYKEKLTETIKSIDKKMTDMAVGKPQQLTKITFKDGGSVVLADDEMAIFLNNKNFLNDVADGTTQVTTQDSNINRIVEEKKKQLEVEIEEATDKGAKVLNAAQTKAKQRGATVKDGNKLNAVAQKARQNGQKNVDSILNEATVLQSALTELAPGASIVFLNNDEYLQTMDEVDGKENSVGNFTYKKNDDGTYSIEIQINLDRAVSTTVAHEVGHALLLRTLGMDPKLFDTMRAQLKNVIASKIDNRVLADIDKLISDYSSVGQSEEFLVELGSIMVLNQKKLEISIIEKIAKVISDFIARITGGKVQLFDKISTRVDFVNFMNGMVETLSTGQLAKPIKDKINAVQEQTAGQVPVQSETGVGQEMVEGKPKAESQGITEEGKNQEEVIVDAVENPLTTEDVEGREIEPGYEVFDQPIVVDASKGRTNRKPFRSKASIKRDFTISDNDFADVDAIEGKTMVGFMGDVQITGSVTTPTGLTLSGFGGPNYPAQANRNLEKDADGYFVGKAAVWSSTFEDSTGKLMKRMQDAEGALIGAQQNTGILGNRLMLRYFGEELKTASEKINSEETIVNFINEKIKTQFKKDKNTGVTSTFSEGLGGVESFSSIEEFVDYLDPYFTSDQFVAKYPNSNNIVQKGDKKVTLLESKNTKKDRRIVPYELRGALFVKMFNIDSHKKFGLPSIVPGKGYTYDKTVLEYANDTMFGEAGYGDFVGFVEFDPTTLKLEKVDQSSDFFNPSYEWVITAEKVRFKYFNEFVDGRALFYDNTSASKEANQTPFGLRPKAAAARAIMGSQPITTIEADKVKERQKGFGSKSQLTAPSSDKWSSSLTQAQVDAKLAETGVRTKTENDRLLQETQKGNETQRNNISTYSSFVNGIISKYGKENLASKNILDAGAGLGIGAKAATQAGIANSYKTFEPFPSISDGKWEKFSGTQQPNFTDFAAIENNSQDILVNNAVLNVVPADIRQSIVENIGRVLKPGGQAYVSVRGIKESALMESLAAAKGGKSKNVFLSDSEYYVPGTQGDYQKGFSEVELQAYVQDVLGSQYDVQISREPFWKSNANAPKVVITKKEKATGPFKSKSQLDFTQIRPEYDAVMNQQFGTKKAAYKALVEKGYTPKRIKEAIGLYDFDESAFKQAQSEIAVNAINAVAQTYNDRQDEIKDMINQNIGDMESIYGDLIDQGYSNLEIFTAARDLDFLSPQDLVDIFGAEYRQTVKKAINASTPYPTDFLDELEDDARTLKVSQRAADVADVVRETGLGLVDSAVAIDALLEYLKTNGFDQIAIALTEGVKQFAKDRGILEKTADWADAVTSGTLGDKLYSPEAINYAFSVSSELFSQAGRILQLARYFNETNQLAMIERQLSASGVVLTQMQKQTLEALVNDYKAAQDDNKAKLKALEEDWSDQAWEAFNESEKAVGMATIRVAQFLEARKPIFWNERLTSGAARALLNVGTTVLSFVANVENNIWSTNWAARTIQKFRDALGSGIKGNTLSFSNWRMARKLTSKRMWFDMHNNAKFGVMDTTQGINRYYDNLAQVNFFRDVKWNYNFMKAMVKKVLNRDFESMTPEEQADAYDLTLVKLKSGDVELRDGKTYTFARSLAWSLGTGPILAASRGNASLLLNTGGPLFAEATGRIMSYGGDIAFGYMAAQRAMIDYFQNVQGTRFQNGIFDSMLNEADGKMDEKTIRALSEILRADAELYSRFEKEGLKRTLLGDNIISGGISLLRGKLRKKIRTLYTENRKVVGGSTIAEELRREVLTGRGLIKNTLQVVDVGLFTLMPFTKVPVNFLGSAIAKTVPFLAGPKYIFAEGLYQFKYNEFNKKYPGIPPLTTDKQKRDYEKAKIDLFAAKRQATYDSAQFVTSLAIYGIAMSAVKAGAILTDGGGDPEKEKALKTFGLRGGLYNATLHWEYLTSGMPSNFLARRKGFAKEGDVMLNTNNAGFLGYAMGLYASVYDGERKQEADNVMSLFDTQKSALSMLATTAVSSGIENLPMFQGLARIGELLNDLKTPESSKNAWNNFASGTLSTSTAVFFPSFFSLMSKGNAEMVQSAGEINKRAENPNWPSVYGDVAVRVVQKLNRNISFNEATRNEYYKAQIGPFGEDLSYKVTVAEPGTAAAYIQAFIDPFAIRMFSAPAKENQKEIQAYRESAQLFGGMTNLALIFQHMTGRDFEWKPDGKTSSFFGIITNPMKNQFSYSNSAKNVGGLDEENTYKLFDYNLPNDLYRQELKLRGEEFRKAMRKYIGKFETTTAQVKTAVEDDDLERAKRLITDVFEEYQSTLAEAQKDYLLNYQTNREKQYLSTMNNRKLFTEKEKEIMKKNGFMNEEGLIP
jgi:SAM-dependent methyltransferase